MSVLRLLTVYNEKDIIRENIEYFISQGIESVVLDNFSKDGTYEILKEYEGKGIRWIERYKSDFYDIVKLNTILLQLAFKEKEDLFVWVDADEILSIFDSRFDLKDSIVKLFEHFNNDCFSTVKMEFYHTDKNHLFKEKISFGDFKYFALSRNWKNVIFKKDPRIKTYVDKPYYYDDNMNELPFNVKGDIFYLKHYPFRTIRQAKKKIYRGLPATDSPDALNSHLRYFKEDMENKIVRNKEKLIEFKDYKNFFVDIMTSHFPELSEFYLNLYDFLL